ncbi:MULTISPECIES: hypothetical protein, partial [Mobiluncus]|uniref:hypothetical protein n=1 Tax=Mobiluncus TaxID=2050 RepID=UPI001B8B778D
STTTLSTPTTPTQSAFKKAKSNPRDTPSQTHILTLNPTVAQWLTGTSQVSAVLRRKPATA